MKGPEKKRETKHVHPFLLSLVNVEGSALGEFQTETREHSVSVETLGRGSFPRHTGHVKDRRRRRADPGHH